MNSLALDLGGTKIEVCRVINNQKARLLKKYPTDRKIVGTPLFLTELKKIINKHLTAQDKKICLASKGLVSKGKLLKTSLFGQDNFPLAEILTKEFKRPCFVENDVVCMALAENQLGQATKAQSFILLNLGTGLRLAFIHNGQLINGFNNQAGEISLLKAPGLAGGLEKGVSGNGLTNIYQKITKQKKSAKEILTAAKQDKNAQQAIKIFQKRLADLLTAISLFYNPELIVIDGSLKKSANKFLPQAQKIYQAQTGKPFHFRKIEISHLQYSACLGAVMASLKK